MEDYNKLLDRLDNVLIKNESLQDDLKAEQSGNLRKIKKIKGLNELVEEQAKRIDNLNYMYDILEDKNKALKKSLKKGYESCNDYSELVNDQAEEIKELKKDVEFYRSKVKVLLDDMVQFGRQAYVKSIDDDINLGNKGGKNAK